MALDRRGFLAGAAVTVAGVPLLGLTPAQAVTPEVAKHPFPSGESVRVLVTGDAGTGTATQWAVADAARAAHARAPFGLALGLGDNIYEHGPDGPGDVQFADKFEHPNHGLDFPWLMVLGNHDNSSALPGDGGWLLRGNDEVAYHALSARWWMPSRYYSVRVPEQNPVVEFFVLDINPAAAYLPPLDPYWSGTGVFMAEQAAWLDRALAESPARWKVACTHQPFWSNGPHGDAGRYEGLTVEPVNGVHVRRFLDEHVLGRCQLLFSGHDHTLQVLEPGPGTRGTVQLVSGAAAKTATGLPAGGAGAHPARFDTRHQLGFMVAEFRRGGIELEVVTVDPGSGAAASEFRGALA
ncbi:metallophosphoesterase [Nocardia sp. NPDC057227]|uniref:metallophosphoesterase n=1 Tax=Nocardia sp. NPDC057227 TaxID=3346056 RepID=UPI00362A1B5E